MLAGDHADIVHHPIDLTQYIRSTGPRQHRSRSSMGAFRFPLHIVDSDSIRLHKPNSDRSSGPLSFKLRLIKQVPYIRSIILPNM